MPRRRSDAYPFVAVRDLLGILRAMWLATDAANEMRRLQISEVARQLRASLELAKASTPGTKGYAEAWARAERATAKIGTLVDCVSALEPVVLAAKARVVGIRGGGIRQKQGPRH